MTRKRDFPEFLCGSCRKTICEDCASIAEEYERLYSVQKLRLMTLEEENEEYKLKIASLERRICDTERVAKIGYPEMMTGYIDYLMQNPPK